MSELSFEIEEIRKQYGDNLLILGHHYQRPEVLAHADFRGDSLELARKASQSHAKIIIFCGVRFMAESADILTGPDQRVYLSDGGATCPMAEMADEAQAEIAFARLNRVVSGVWTPVVYVNSTAEVKAFCGKHGGSACTSGNCDRVMGHYLSAGRRIFFLPDEHLATNTAHDLGLPDDSVAVYDPKLPDGGLSDEDVAKARVIVWKGFCHVHQAFSSGQISEIRKQFPGAKIIIHPEAPKNVVRDADEHGSTAKIIKFVENAPAGSVVAVGTEFKLVARLADENRGRVTVYPITQSSCPNMAKTTEAGLLYTIKNLPASALVHVPDDIAASARICLDNMLSL